MDVRCPTIGQVTVETGYIESEMEIVCVDCQDIVPNCLFCFNSTSCSLCKSGYYETQLYDAFGNMNTICLKGFCGLFGVGVNCDTDRETVEVFNCLKTEIFSDYDDKESCLVCDPGYYRYVYDFRFDQLTLTLTMMWNCALREGTLVMDAFVRNEMTDYGAFMDRDLLWSQL